MWYTLRFSCAAQEGCRQSLHCDAEYRVNVVTVKKQASAVGGNTLSLLKRKVSVYWI